MLQVPQTRIVREAISSPLAVEEYGLRELLEARASFWEYRIAMNPRFELQGNGSRACWHASCVNSGTTSKLASDRFCY